MGRTAKIRHQRRYRAQRSGALEEVLAVRRERRQAGQERSRVGHETRVSFAMIRRAQEAEYRARRALTEPMSSPPRAEPAKWPADVAPVSDAAVDTYRDLLKLRHVGGLMKAIVLFVGLVLGSAAGCGDVVAVTQGVFDAQIEMGEGAAVKRLAGDVSGGGGAAGADSSAGVRPEADASSLPEIGVEAGAESKPEVVLDVAQDVVEVVPGRTNGAACSAGAECASGFCVGTPGRCCDKACSGPCQSCATGYCASVNDGKVCGAETCDGTAAGTGCAMVQQRCKMGVCEKTVDNCCVRPRYCCETTSTCSSYCAFQLPGKAECHRTDMKACVSGQVCSAGAC